jgi:anti-sigma regulatory factor (Ser/Thr protein kinase)
MEAVWIMTMMEEEQHLVSDVVLTSGVLCASDLPVIRNDVAVVAHGAGLDEEDAHRFVLAVSEAASNVILHAGGFGEVSVRISDGALVAEIVDGGPGIDDTAPGCPEPGARHGRGLWLMRRCVDRVEVFSRSIGTTVRLIKLIAMLRTAPAFA